MKLPSTVLLIGGSGFVGSALANRLAAAGVRIVVPTRRRVRANHLLPLPSAEIVEANVFDAATLRRLMSGADAVVNCVGVLHSRSGAPWGADFQRAHVDLPTRIVAAARESGVKQLVHISALGADCAGPSQYLRSKAAGEEAIRSAGSEIAWTILRPSVIFGPNDSFLNLFASLLKRVPLMPLGGADARFQPVYVGDVAAVAVEALQRAEAAGQTYEVAGPTVYSLGELVKYVGRLTGRPRPVIPLPGALAGLQAAFLELLPGPPMSRDNLRSMERPSVAAGAPLPWGWQPQALEALAPTWLGKANKRGRVSVWLRRRGEF